MEVEASGRVLPEGQYDSCACCRRPLGVLRSFPCESCAAPFTVLQPVCLACGFWRQRVDLACETCESEEGQNDPCQYCRRRLPSVSGNRTCGSYKSVVRGDDGRDKTIAVSGCGRNPPVKCAFCRKVLPVRPGRWTELLAFRNISASDGKKRFYCNAVCHDRALELRIENVRRGE